MVGPVLASSSTKKVLVLGVLLLAPLYSERLVFDGLLLLVLRRN
jgi:hypothetical protein